MRSWSLLRAQQQFCQRSSSLRSNCTSPRVNCSARTTSSAPLTTRRTASSSPSTAPLLTRKANRELPPLSRINNPWRTWRHMPLVAVVLVAGGAAVMNYEKLNHSVVSSSMYALRVHPLARLSLGDEIYFAHRVPWIAGTIDQVHGKIDVNFAVKGKSAKGKMRFRATKEKGDEFFQTRIWTLELENGEVIDLLKEEGEVDPMSRSEV